ncbi:hypothetical protein TNCV_3760411 [Trichonephila clavipes]|nr:hypothetical protein TNCV_3760411 [Trichonephila clavipes]
MIDGATTYPHIHNFAMGLDGWDIFSSPCTRDSAHKTFGPTDLTSTFSVSTRKVFGGIGHRTQAFRSGVRCPNHYASCNWSLKVPFITCYRGWLGFSHPPTLWGWNSKYSWYGPKTPAGKGDGDSPSTLGI